MGERVDKWRKGKGIIIFLGWYVTISQDELLGTEAAAQVSIRNSGCRVVGDCI